VQLDGSGKTNRFSHSAFDPRAQREMLPLQLLCPPLTNLMAVGSQVPAIRTPAVRVKAANAEGCKPRFEFSENLILAATKDIG
jgi:hypothetical protein